MAEAQLTAEERKKGIYSLTWPKKPLGFSIVMDTTGKNAYVSSIQNTSNVQKGLKLAAQIVEINGKDQKNRKHSDILNSIKSANLPITLKFQPRSFANDPDAAAEDKALDNIPKVLTFKGAPESNAHRVNGYFELITTKINDRHVWQRKDELEDPILVWWWPKAKNGLGEDLWMIGRKSYVNKQGAYACVVSSEKLPTDIHKTWKAWDPTADNKKTGGKGDFVDAEIVIDQTDF